MAFNPAGKGLAAQIFRPEPARLALLRSAWAVAVGPELARRTEVIAVEGRTLRVRVPDAGWRKVLHRMQGQIVYRLRAIAGELGPARIGFSDGQVTLAAEVKASAPEQNEGSTAMGPALAAAVDGIPDPELRKAFVAPAERYLARVGPSRRAKETSDA